MAENVVVVLGSLAIFAFVTIAVVALVYDRPIKLKASQKTLEVDTKVDRESVRDAQEQLAESRDVSAVGKR